MLIKTKLWVYTKPLILFIALSSLLSPAFSKDDNIDVFIDGCHLHMPIPSPNNWYGIFTFNNKGKTISKLLKAELLQKKKLAHVDDLYNYCIKSKTNEVKNINAIALLKGHEFKSKTLKSATTSKNNFKELGQGALSGGSPFPTTEETITITFEKSNYYLKQVTDLNDNSGHHKLTLIHNGIKQDIFNRAGNYEGATGFYIIWAGDLDGDNMLDLLVNLPVHYASPYHLRLFLSSKAKHSHLVKQVAERGFLSP